MLAKLNASASVRNPCTQVAFFDSGPGRQGELCICDHAYSCEIPLIGLVNGGVNLGAEVGGRRASLEVSAEGRGKERAEDDLGTTRIAVSI